MKTSCALFRALPCVIVLSVLGAVVGACDKSDQSSPSATTQPAESPSTGPVSTAQPQTAPSTSVASNSHPGRIAAGDTLSIRVLELGGPGTASTMPVHVAADGTIRPFALDAVHVAGLDDGDAEIAIAKAYNNANIIREPVVLIRRLQLASVMESSTTGPMGTFDLVRVSVADLEGPGTETVRIARLNGDGVITLPYIGAQKLAGLTEASAEKAIAAAYQEQHIVQSAMVSVFLLEKAPADAESKDLPDAPIQPVPASLESFFRDDGRVAAVQKK